MRRLLLLTSVLVCAATVLGQSPRANTRGSAPVAASATVRGVVVDSLGAPILRATVTLQRVGAEDDLKAEYTDGDGAFSFTSVRPGQYMLKAERAGYAAVNSLADGRVVVRASGDPPSVLLRLTASAAIVGVVRDENGNPLPQAQVAALQRRYVRGYRTTIAAQATTDDQGSFRMGGLQPGKYFVVASSKRTVGTRRYPPQYYPDVNSAEFASVLTLRAGEEMPMQFVMHPARTLTLRGRVEGASAGHECRVEVVSRDIVQSALTSQGAQTVDARFSVTGLLPGEYTVTATQFEDGRERWDRRTVVIGEDGDADVMLALRPPNFPVVVEGTVRLANYERLNGSVRLEAAPLQDADAGLTMLSDVSGSVGRDGSFALNAVKNGYYFFPVFETRGLADCYIKQVLVSSRDVTGQAFKVNGPTSLTLVIGDDGASVNGMVVDAKNQPVAGARVAAVPESNLRAWSAMYRVTTSASDGTFQLRGLRPGAYHLFAFAYLEDSNVIFDPEFTAANEINAAKLNATAKTKYEVTLRTSVPIE